MPWVTLSEDATEVLELFQIPQASRPGLVELPDGDSRVQRFLGEPAGQTALEATTTLAQVFLASQLTETGPWPGWIQVELFKSLAALKEALSNGAPPASLIPAVTSLANEFEENGVTYSIAQLKADLIERYTPVPTEE